MSEIPLSDKKYSPPVADLYHMANMPLAARLSYYATFISKEGENMDAPIDKLGDLLREAAQALSADSEHSGDGESVRLRIIEAALRHFPQGNDLYGEYTQWKEQLDKALEPFAQPEAARKVCEWTPDDDLVHHTGCGHAFVFDSGTPEENSAKFCQYCGGNLVVSPQRRNDVG